ncbi:TPA: pyocin knob domain-containing S74 family peptidase [Aeromonas salmonicida subsp. pectinolytica]
MATDALKINKTTKRVETLNGFQLHDGTNRVYSDGNKPTPGTLGAVAKSGDTLTGNLKGPEFIQTTPQSNDGAASARKDYVDAKFNAVIVPTGTAPIVVNNSVISIVPSSASTAGSMSAADKSKLDGISNSLYVELTSTSVDLNTLGGITDANNSSAGVYRQEASANATTAKHYPVRLAGTLLVTPSAHGCHQEYTTFTGRKFHRGLSGTFTGTGPWGEWTEFYSEVSPKQFVNKVGDTMTGALIATQFKASSDYGFVRSTNDAQGMFVGADGRTIIGGGTGALILRPQGINNAAGESVFNNDGTIAISKTGTADNHLVTKKYVDDKVGTAVQSVTATGAVKSTGGINPVISLANATNAADGAMSFADKAKLDGIPAAAVNRTGDTMTGQLIINNASGLDGIQLLGTPSATGDNARGISGFLADGSKRTWGTGILTTNGVASYAYLGFGENPWGNSVRVYADKVTSATSISAPDFIQTTAQSTNAAASTRKDYVDAQVKAIDVKNVAKAGDTMTGNLTVPKILLSAAQGSEVNALTRKDYVDAQVGAVDAKNVAKAGDTMTGALNFAQIKSAASFWHKSSIKFADGANTHFHLFSEGSAFKISSGTTGQTNLVSVDSAGNMDIAGSTASKYFRTNELGGTNAVAPYRSASQGGSFATMYNRHASFHTDVVQTGSNYAPNTSIQYQHNAGWAGMYSTGVLINSAADPGAYCIAHISSNGGDSFTWNFDGKTGRFTSGAISVTNIDVGGLVTAGQIRTTTGGITINNSNPTVLFQDTDNKSAFAHVNSNNFYILRSAGNNGTAWDGGPNNVHPMTLSLDNGDATFSRNGSFNDVQIRSDIRLKSNLLPIVGALDKVYTLSGFTFDKFGCDKREAGIIAQDLKKVLPESVGSFKTTAGEEFLTVSNSGVNALLVEAIKELTDRVKYLESKIN